MVFSCQILQVAGHGKVSGTVSESAARRRDAGHWRSQWQCGTALQRCSAAGQRLGATAPVLGQPPARTSRAGGIPGSHCSHQCLASPHNKSIRTKKITISIQTLRTKGPVQPAAPPALAAAATASGGLASLAHGPAWGQARPALLIFSTATWANLALISHCFVKLAVYHSVFVTSPKSEMLMCVAFASRVE